MDAPAVPVESAAALLKLLRETPAGSEPSLQGELERVLANASSGAPRSAPNLGATGRIRARLFAHREIASLQSAGAVEGLASNVPEAIVELNELYTHTTRFDVARRLLQIYTARWPGARPLAILPPIVGEVDGPVDGFRDDRNSDLQIAPAPQAGAAFVVFCGLRHAFGVQLNVLHHCCLAKHGAHVVYVRDFAQNLYLTGLSSTGGPPESCAALQGVFSRLGARKLVFIGNSSGVFGALHYGAMLGAHRVLLFSGPTSLDIGLEESERQAYPRLLKLREAGEIEWPNLRETYGARSTPVSLYYGGKNRVDVAQAANLAGLPNVELHPVETASHFVLDYLAASGEMDRVFAGAAA